PRLRSGAFFIRKTLMQGRKGGAMSLFRYKGSKVWTMDFVFHGQRVRESTKTRNLTNARTIERNRRTALEDGSAGIKKVKTGKLFKSAAEEYMAAEKASLKPNQKGGHAS